jgi:hypothetical protein
MGKSQEKVHLKKVFGELNKISQRHRQIFNLELILYKPKFLKIFGRLIIVAFKIFSVF